MSGRTRAGLVTHLYGMPADKDAIRAVAAARGTLAPRGLGAAARRTEEHVEDVAETFGARGGAEAPVGGALVGGDVGNCTWLMFDG